VRRAGGIAAVREQALGCRACPLWQDATQTVFGEGPRDASIVLVGERWAAADAHSTHAGRGTP